VIFPQKVKWLRGKEFPGMPENGPSPAPGRSWRRGLRAALLLLSLWLCGCAILHDGPANTVPTVSDHGAPASTPAASTPAASVPTPGAFVIAPDAPVPAAAIFPEAPGEGGSRQTGAAVCLPEFPDRDGWYGGDGAYSIQLDDWRVLWLFGDTFVSEEEGRRDRTGMAVVLGTTVAVSTCAADDFRIRYRLKRKDGKFVSSFGEGEWLWPQDPFLAAGAIYIPLIAVRAAPEQKGPFKFAVAGHRLARIGDFTGDDPNRWAVDYLDLTPGIPRGIKAFATTSVVHGNHVYFYPLYSETGEGRAVLGNILARIPLDRLAAPARSIQYLHSDGRWDAELDHRRVKVVLEAAVSELSVRYHPERGEWVAVYMSLENNGDRMLYRTAAALEGPWSAAKVLVGTIPEVTRHSPRFDRNNFCYAGKEHREFSRGKNMVVTYVCNSYEDFEKVTSFIRRNLFLYRPVVVAVPSPS